MSVISPSYKRTMENHAVLFLFALTGLMYLVGFHFYKLHFIVLIPLAFHVVHDIWFRLQPVRWKQHGRDCKSTLEGVRAAMQYTAFLFGFIGVGLGATFKGGIPQHIKGLFSSSILLQGYLLAIIVMAGLMLLFIPVVYTNKSESSNSQEPSIALKNYYTFVLIIQKSLIILSVYLLLIITSNYIHNG